MARQTQLDARYRRAKEQGYAARSVFKLEDMDRRYQLLRKGQKVLDLGCHPGSWLQYAAGRVGSSGLVVGVDLKPPTADLPPWVRAVQADVLELTPEALAEFAPAFDAVLSDVAPATTGVAHADQAKSLALAEAAFMLALALLKPGGVFVAKVYQGAGTDELIRRVKLAFTLGKGHKPPGSRSASRETYIVGRGLKEETGA